MKKLLPYIISFLSSVTFAEPWNGSANVTYDIASTPIEAIPLINYSIWEINSRLGTHLNFMGGANFQSEYIIHITFKDFLWFMYSGYDMFTDGITSKTYYPDSGEVLNTTIIINSTLFSVGMCGKYTIVHELGHSVSVGPGEHSTNVNDVMYPYKVHCNYTLSHSDAVVIGRPLVNCMANITSEGDIYIPSIENQAAFLKKLDNTYEWKLDKLSSTHTSCYINRLKIPSMELSIQGSGLDFSVEASLEWIGNDTWRLLNAEIYE